MTHRLMCAACGLDFEEHHKHTREECALRQATIEVEESDRIVSAIDERVEGERERLRHAIDRMRTTIDSVARALDLGGPIGADSSGAITTTALEIATRIAIHDAFELVERGE